MVYVIHIDTKVKVSSKETQGKWRVYKTKKPIITQKYESFSRGGYIFRDGDWLVWVKHQDVSVFSADRSRFICGTCGADYPSNPDDPWVDCPQCVKSRCASGAVEFREAEDVFAAARSVFH